MSFQAEIIGDVVVVRWHDPEEGDATELQGLIASARAEVGSDLIYIPIIPKSGALPTDGVRKEMSGVLSNMLDNCSSIHLILEGTGMKQATKRMIAAGFLMIKGSKKMFVHETLKEGLAASKLNESEVENVLQKMQEAKIICD